MNDNHNIQQVRNTINYLVHKANDSYDTGFVSCEYKRDLVELKWYIEDALEKCPTFGHVEEQWYQQRTLQLLKK